VSPIVPTVSSHTQGSVQQTPGFTFGQTSPGVGGAGAASGSGTRSPMVVGVPFTPGLSGPVQVGTGLPVIVTSGWLTLSTPAASKGAVVNAIGYRTAGTRSAQRSGITPIAISSPIHRSVTAGSLASQRGSSQLSTRWTFISGQISIPPAASSQEHGRPVTPLAPPPPASPLVGLGSGAISLISLGGGAGGPSGLLIVFAALALFAWRLLRLQSLRLPQGIVLSNLVPPG
jgi:hypothetical protein